MLWDEPGGKRAYLPALPALCGVWGRVVFKPQALPTQMCRGWGSNPGPSGYSQSQKNTSTQTLDISGTLQHGNSPHSLNCKETNVQIMHISSLVYEKSKQTTLGKGNYHYSTASRFGKLFNKLLKSTKFNSPLNLNKATPIF